MARVEREEAAERQIAQGSERYMRSERANATCHCMQRESGLERSVCWSAQDMCVTVERQIR